MKDTNFTISYKRQANSILSTTSGKTDTSSRQTSIMNRRANAQTSSTSGQRSTASVKTRAPSEQMCTNSGRKLLRVTSQVIL